MMWEFVIGVSATFGIIALGAILTGVIDPRRWRRKLKGGEIRRVSVIDLTDGQIEEGKEMKQINGRWAVRDYGDRWHSVDDTGRYGARIAPMGGPRMQVLDFENVVKMVEVPKINPPGTYPKVDVAQVPEQHEFARHESEIYMLKSQVMALQVALEGATKEIETLRKLVTPAAVSELAGLCEAMEKREVA